MSFLPRSHFTPAQYLEIERQAEYKSEYISGEIYARAGASRTHNRITLNIGSSLTAQLVTASCEPYVSDLRVRVSPKCYTYPDVVVACSDIEFEDSHLDTLLNPIVIMEVLSPSTQRDDRSWKFRDYQQIAPLQDYVLVAQDSPFIQHFSRQSTDEWLLRMMTEMEDSLSLASIGCTLSLTAIYARVQFSTVSEQ